MECQFVKFYLFLSSLFSVTIFHRPKAFRSLAQQSLLRDFHNARAAHKKGLLRVRQALAPRVACPAHIKSHKGRCRSAGKKRPPPFQAPKPARTKRRRGPAARGGRHCPRLQGDLSRTAHTVPKTNTGMRPQGAYRKPFPPQKAPLFAGEGVCTGQNSPIGTGNKKGRDILFGCPFLFHVQPTPQPANFANTKALLHRSKAPDLAARGAASLKIPEKNSRPVKKSARRPPSPLCLQAGWKGACFFFSYFSGKISSCPGKIREGFEIRARLSS